jgi:hypothetical protein
MASRGEILDQIDFIALIKFYIKYIIRFVRFSKTVHG